MSNETLITIFNITSFIDLVLIVVCYSASGIYNILFLRKAVWTDYSWIKISLTFCCFVFFVIFSYVFVMTLLNTPVTKELFGTVVVRTAISWMGIALLFASRARYNTLMHGGEKWIQKH